MKKDLEKTVVVFKIFKGEIIALFPKAIFGPEKIYCYSHIGQHSGAGRALIKCKNANLEQYKALKNELESIGYDLIVRNKQ